LDKQFRIIASSNGSARAAWAWFTGMYEDLKRFAFAAQALGSLASRFP
jgi:hypothetical protein